MMGGVSMLDERVPLVLIVEDETHIAEALAFLIEEYGYNARIVHNGKQALAAIERELPDLIISDLMMPQMSGAELTRALRERGGPTPPIVLMSAAGRGHVEGLGADATLGKPFELTEVEALLHRFIPR